MDAPIDHIRTVFAAAPWKALPDAALAPCRHVPTMLTEEEQRLYLWLVRDWAVGAGEIVDLGSFVGGSTARLAEGLRCAGHPSLVHAFDRFTVDEATKRRHLYPAGIEPFSGADMLDLAQRLLAPWDRQITFYVGDILARRWNGDPIEVLAIDAAKSADLADHIAESFFPSLIPGRSVVVQQDLLHYAQPWLPAQMALYPDHFIPLTHCPRDSVTYLCIRAVAPDEIQQRRLAGRDDAELTALIRKSARRLADHVKRYRFAQQVRCLRANPGERLAWRMRRG